MSLELYNDRVIFSVWNAQTREIEHGFTLYDDRDRGRTSHVAQLHRMISHWCPDCECAFRKADVPHGLSAEPPKCPVCGSGLDEFDRETIAPEPGDELEGMFPKGKDDG